MCRPAIDSDVCHVVHRAQIEPSRAAARHPLGPSLRDREYTPKKSARQSTVVHSCIVADDNSRETARPSFDG